MMNMKIGFLTNNLDIRNGWGSYSVNLVKELEKKGVEAIVLSGRVGYFRARQTLKDCQVIHSLTEPPAFFSSLISAGRPFFITAHGTYAVRPLARNGWDGFKLRWAYKKANAVVCVSRFTQAQIKKLAPETKTLVINNGVEFERFFRAQTVAEPLEEMVRNRFPVILGVGGLKERKGYHISIPAAAALKKKYPNFLYLVGGKQSDTDYFNRLNVLVNQHGLQDNVKFIEPDDNQLVALYQAADIFLLTPINEDNNFEGYGLVFLEAGAAGRPSIGSLDCGAEDAIEHEQTGFLVKQNAVAAVGAALIELAQNNELRKKMGQNAREFARQKSWDIVASDYLKLYENSISI